MVIGSKKVRTLVHSYERKTIQKLNRVKAQRCAASFQILQTLESMLKSICRLEKSEEHWNRQCINAPYPTDTSFGLNEVVWDPDSYYVCALCTSHAVLTV